MAPQSDNKCTMCEKESSEGTIFPKCAKCQAAWYCSKDCQKKDWPKHKKACRKPGTQSLPMPQMANYFNSIRDEDKTYERMIDCFRLRCEDDYTWGQHNHGVYGGDNPMPVFEDFLMKAKAADMLPSWWTAEKEAACKQKAETDDWADISCAVEKSDIQEHYGDNMMPMTLRMAAERIYGGGYGMGQTPMPDDHECMC